MTQNNSRSLKASIAEGSTDGKYRKVAPNRTVDPGMGEEITKANRADLHPYWNYDYIDREDPVKVMPLTDEARASRGGGQDPYFNEMGHTL